MKRLIILIFLILIALLGLFAYRLATYTFITVKFKELRPFHGKIPVYYKGIEIGRAQDKKHSGDFLHTYVKVVLYPKNLMLPINTTVLLKKEKRDKHENDFLELIYPAEPSKELLSDGAVIDGKATVDLETYLANQDPDDLEQIKQNLTAGTENLSLAFSSLSDLFTTLNDTVEENRSGLKKSSNNLALTTNNFNQITTKLNKSLKQESLDNSVSNIESSTDSVHKSSKNLEKITENLAVTTNSVNEIMPAIDSVIYQTQGILSNVDEITGGVKEHFKKRFGGFRILFGVTVKPQKEGACAP